LKYRRKGGREGRVGGEITTAGLERLKRKKTRTAYNFNMIAR